MHTKIWYDLEKNFHEIFMFEVYLLVGTLWQLCEMSEIRVVRGEPGANSTSSHA